jgi:dihydroflavonol-4-reductase
VGYIDARDVALGHIAAAEQGRTGERYILSGHNLTHQETMAIIAAELGVRAPALEIPGWLLTLAAPVVHWLGKMGLQLPVDRARVLASRHFMYYDNSKAVNELGLAVRPFAESVRDTYRWYVDHDYFSRRGITRLPVI